MKARANEGIHSPTRPSKAQASLAGGVPLTVSPQEHETPFALELRWLVETILTSAQRPNGSIRVITRTEFNGFRESLEALEKRWIEREHQVILMERELAARRGEVELRERALESAEHMLNAREKLLHSKVGQLHSQAKAAETEAIAALRKELEQQEKALHDREHQLKQRQSAVEAAEVMLRQKDKAQDEFASLLDKRAEQIALREQKQARTGS